MSKYVKNGSQWKGRCEKVERRGGTKGKREVVQEVTTGKECIVMKTKRSR